VHRPAVNIALSLLKLADLITLYLNLIPSSTIRPCLSKAGPCPACPACMRFSTAPPMGPLQPVRRSDRNGLSIPARPGHPYGHNKLSVRWLGDSRHSFQVCASKSQTQPTPDQCIASAADITPLSWPVSAGALRQSGAGVLRTTGGSAANRAVCCWPMHATHQRHLDHAWCWSAQWRALGWV